MAAEGKKRRKKRKDSTCSIKPPLDFIESPLNGQKYYCTPVQAARRPFLAASMPVDDQVSMKWVSPQFPDRIENEEELLALLKPNKKSRRRKKEKENTENIPRQLASNKHLLDELDFECKNVRDRDTDEKSKVPCRRSQRLRKLKKAHFLFQEPQVMTPVNKQGAVVLAYETPDQELLAAVERKCLSTKRGR